MSPGAKPLGTYLCIDRLGIGVFRYVRLVHEHNQKAVMYCHVWGKDERLDHGAQKGREEECEGG